MHIPGNILATRSDSRGYTVTCTDYVDEQTGPNLLRKGTHYITHPNGETIQAGYWMDFPEADNDRAVYYRRPLHERAAIDLWYQCERYAGLANDFEHHRFGEWLPKETFNQRLQTRYEEVQRLHPYYRKSEIWDIFFKWARRMMKKKDFIRNTVAPTASQMTTLTINASMDAPEEWADSEDDFLAERGIDIDLPTDVNHRHVMSLLFDGFTERLKTAGITVGDATSFV